MVHLARCCTPVPGDDAVGYITRGRGVTVHREDCPNIRNLDLERRVEVSWAATEKATYPVRLKVMAMDEKGLLAAVSNAISAGEANIVSAKVTTTPDHSAVFNFVVEVSGGDHLKRVLSGIRKVEGVNWVERISRS